MADDEMKTLRVNLLGGFSLEYGDEPVALGRNTASKFIQLLQLIWLQDGKGITKAEILRDLYEAEDLSNPNNSFNNLIFQMRKQMTAAGLPRKDYIVRRGKVYIADPAVPLQVDANEFRELIEKSQAEPDEAKKYEYCRKALQIYRGELLPESSTRSWVVTQSVIFHGFFDQAVNFCGQYAKKNRDYDRMYRIYEQAARIYPDNDWQAYQIDALICAEQYSRAYQLYDETVHRYSEEMGLPPSDKMMDNYRRMSEKLTSPTGRLNEIRSSLQEDPATGAYYCAYPGFVDSCHVLERNMERLGYSVFLILCNLVDYEGKPFVNREKLEEKSEILRNTIGRSLRKGDTYTKYSASQYLILLVGSSREGCDIVAKRISQNLKETEGNKADVTCSSLSLADLYDMP